MPKIYLIEGPVGAGKSTHAALLASKLQAVHIALDAWFAVLYSPDRPSKGFDPSWYIARKERLIDLIWAHSRIILGNGLDVILELGLIQRNARESFCARVEAEGYEIALYVLDAPREVRRERVRRRNIEMSETFAMVVPDHVFEIASDMWEPPDAIECEQYNIQFISSER